MHTLKAPVRLLHLEDNPRAAQLVQATLESDGLSCQITHVRSRAGFESAVNSHAFDLVLCDYDIPGYKGLTAMKRLHRSHPHLPVIFLSGAMGDDPSADCISRGAADFVRKYQLDRLAPAMRRALQSGVVIRRHLEAVAPPRELVRPLATKPRAVAA